MRVRPGLEFDLPIAPSDPDQITYGNSITYKVRYGGPARFNAFGGVPSYLDAPYYNSNQNIFLALNLMAKDLNGNGTQFFTHDYFDTNDTYREMNWAYHRSMYTGSPEGSYNQGFLWSNVSIGDTLTITIPTSDVHRVRSSFQLNTSVMSDTLEDRLASDITLQTRLNVMAAYQTLDTGDTHSSNPSAMSQWVIIQKDFSPGDTIPTLEFTSTPQEAFVGENMNFQWSVTGAD